MRPDRAPPPTRGSTRGAGVGPDARRGSPAYAGIDPLALGSVAADGGLPRLRGDRPELCVRIESGP